MEERKLSSTNFEKMPIWEMQNYLKNIKERINNNQKEIKLVLNKYDQSKKAFAIKKDEEKYDELLIENQSLDGEVKRLETLIENKLEQEKIRNRLVALENRYQDIAEEFDQVANAAIIDQDRFNALLAEGDNIFEEKQKLKKQLLPSEEQQLNKQLKFEKYARSISNKSDVGGFPEVKIRHDQLLYQTGDVGTTYRLKFAAIEKKMRQMLARYRALKEQEDTLEVIKANEKKIQRIREELDKVDNEMLELVKNKNTPSYIRLLYKNERFPSEKEIAPQEALAEEQRLVSKEPLRDVEPIKRRKKVSWAASVEEYEAGRPERERKRVEIELARQHSIAQSVQQTSESELKLPSEIITKKTPLKALVRPEGEKRKAEIESARKRRITPSAQQSFESPKFAPEIITRELLLKQPEKPQRVLQPESEEKLKNELKRLGQLLGQLLHALNVV